MRIFNKLSNYLLKNKIDDLINELILNNFTNKTILKYIREIPREIFVKKKFVNFSYHNRPLPIDCNQTISQPLVVANMIDCLNIKKSDLVLEIGTGTG